MGRTNNKVVRLPKVGKSSKGAAIIAPWNKSIALQVLIPFIVIGGLAFSSMLVSVWVTLDAQDDAEAINLAGSMRMQSYRIASRLQAFDAGELSRSEAKKVMAREVESMDRKLYQSSISAVAEEEQALQKTYQQVVNLWEGRRKAVVLALNSEDYLPTVAGFVEAIDDLVVAIQHDSEDKNELLGMYQGISIVLSLMALLFVGMRTDQNVVSPLKDLVQAAEHAKRGDFSYRAYYERSDEAGLLCQTFNKMSENLARSYAELEGRVEQRTRELMLSNRRLDFLYHASRHLSKHQMEPQTIKQLLADLSDVLAVERVTMYRAGEPNSQAHYDIDGKAFNNNDPADEQRFPLQDQDDYFGYLAVSTTFGEALTDWQYRLINTVVDLISSSMALQYQETVNQRLMLFEERSVIARELHDSLAQSLSYLNLQLQRLNRLIEKQVDQKTIQKTIDDMQEGLSTSYKHLRELLKTFRMKINAPTLQQALHAVIEEFKTYDDTMELELDFSMDYSPLTPNEDIHVLQVIREAMNNALKHAKASKIVVRCQEEDHSLQFSVIDNGIGMADVSDKEGHYGLQTMRERSDILNGEFSIQSSVDEGTQVHLQFEPLMWRQSQDHA